MLIRTRQPNLKELGGSIDVKTYRSRKGCFGILLLAGCDSNCIFNFFTCRHPGSTNDAWAITESEGGKILMGDSLPIGARSSVTLPPQYYGVGDDAFVTCETLLTPYGGTQLNMYKYTFFCARQFLGFISVFQLHTLQVPRLLQLSSLGYAPVY